MDPPMNDIREVSLTYRSDCTDASASVKIPVKLDTQFWEALGDIVKEDASLFTVDALISNINECYDDAYRRKGTELLESVICCYVISYFRNKAQERDAQLSHERARRSRDHSALNRPYVH